jgi:hypothetical protein
MVRKCIEAHLDREEFRRLQVVEEEERETLRRIARNFYAPGGKPEGDRLE